MKTIGIMVWVSAIVAACGAYEHVDAPTTTSAPVTTTAQPAETSPDLPFDLPKSMMPAAVNPRPDPDFDLEARAARNRDIDITSTIRKLVLQDPNLSESAKAVDVTTTDRRVILRGRVQTEQERMDIDTKARGTANVIEVDDRIELVP